MSSLFQNEIKDKFKTGLAYVRGPEKSGSSAQNAGSEGGKKCAGRSRRLSRDVRLRNTSLIKRVSMMILVAEQRNYIRRKQ